jgi:hypothetical protein
MKNSFLVIFLLILVNKLHSQNSENPTIDPSNTWITDGWQQTQASTEVRVYSFSNQDTLLNGKWYKEFFYHTTAKKHDTIKTNVFYRQEGHKVWEYDTFKERLVIDYSLQVGDTMSNEVFDESTSLIVAQRDTIFYADGKARVSLKFYCNWEPGTAIPEPNWWITFTEGICSEELLFARKYVCAIDPPHLALRCFYENNTLVYKSDHVDDCLTTSADESKIQSFRIYPNPTSDEIIIISEFDHGVLSVYHSNGQLILQKMITKTDKVDVSAFQSGLYLTQFKTPNGEIIRSKFVKL